MGCLKLQYYENEIPQMRVVKDEKSEQNNAQCFLSTDPITYPWQSTYACFNNNPIVYNDPLGLEGEKQPEGATTYDPDPSQNDNGDNKSLNEFTEKLLNAGLPNRKSKTTNEPSDISNSNSEEASSPWGETWKSLYKSKLKSIAIEKGICTSCTDKELGDHFEDITYGGLMDRSYFNNFRKNTYKYSGSGTGSVPDFVGDSYVTGKIESHWIKGSIWVEAKAKYGGLYMSSNVEQIKRHIDNLYAEFKNGKKKYGLTSFRPALYLVTTADVTVSQAIFDYATEYGVHLVHYIILYRVENDESKYYFEFQTKDSN